MTAAAASSGGGGIDFGQANVGTWLDVDTTTNPGSGIGIDLHASDAIQLTGDNGIVLSATTSPINFSGPDFAFSGDFSGTDDFVVNVGGSVLLNSATGSLGLQPGTITLGSASDTLQIFSNTASVNIQAFSGDIVANPGIGSFYVGTTVTPILLITPDGGGSWNYHMKAGKAWLADL